MVHKDHAMEAEVAAFKGQITSRGNGPLNQLDCFDSIKKESLEVEEYFDVSHCSEELLEKLGSELNPRLPFREGDEEEYHLQNP